MARIGVQAMMLKNEFEADGAFTTLKTLNELGFNVVEISQISMSEANVGEIERARAELGMEIAALSAALETPVGTPGDSLMNDFDKIVANCMRLACRLVRMGMMPLWAMASKKALLDFCSRSNEMAARLAEQDIALYYHNHHIEFAKYDGEYILDIIRESAPLLKFELDVHWIHRGGKDPVTVLKDYAGLVDLVHLKDYRIGQLPRTPTSSSRQVISRPSGRHSKEWFSSRRSGKAISTFSRSSIKACPAGRNICSSSRTTSTVAIPLTASPLPVTTSSRSATALSSEGPNPTAI